MKEIYLLMLVSEVFYLETIFKCGSKRDSWCVNKPYMVWL